MKQSTNLSSFFVVSSIVKNKKRKSLFFYFCFIFNGIVRKFIISVKKFIILKEEKNDV